MRHLIINKNRGWRGLAEVVLAKDSVPYHTMIFSFSQQMWDDLLRGFIVVQDETTYTVIQFDNLEALPKPTQQRSVLIKNFAATIQGETVYSKENWLAESVANHQYEFIRNFRDNKQNHTTSDWNCIGIRVIPRI